MHLKRWLTGIVALPLLIYIIGFGPRRLFCVFLTAVAVGALLEFLRIAAPSLSTSLKILASCVVILLFWFLSSSQFYVVLAIFSLSVIAPLSYHLFTSEEARKNALTQTALLGMGLIYVCLPIAMLLFIYRHPQGGTWIFFLLAVVFATDTGAFYSGRFFGRHLLHPTVSPKKTWEGAVGGLVCSVIPIYFFYPFLHTAKLSILLLAVGLSLLAQMGDLAESVIKRTFDVKDSGKILPGHGGLLDRIDGLLFAAPLLYVFLAWVPGL